MFNVTDSDHRAVWLFGQTWASLREAEISVRANKVISVTSFFCYPNQMQRSWRFRSAPQCFPNKQQAPLQGIEMSSQNLCLDMQCWEKNLFTASLGHSTYKEVWSVSLFLVSKNTLSQSASRQYTLLQAENEGSSYLLNKPIWERLTFFTVADTYS